MILLIETKKTKNYWKKNSSEILMKSLLRNASMILQRNGYSWKWRRCQISRLNMNNQRLAFSKEIINLPKSLLAKICKSMSPNSQKLKTLMKINWITCWNQRISVLVDFLLRKAWWIKVKILEKDLQNKRMKRWRQKLNKHQCLTLFNSRNSI